MGRKYDFELLLMRHGQAQDWSEQGDRGRELTESGRARIARQAGAFEQLGWFWGKSFTSGYARAEQTLGTLREELAQVALEQHHIKLDAPGEIPHLAPSGDPERAARALVEAGSALAGPQPRILAVAHNPIVPKIAGVLIAGDPSMQIALGTGDVIHLFVPAPSPFDLILDPQEQEPLPRAVVLGIYPAHALEAIAAAGVR